MAFNKCKVHECNNQKPRRYILCKACWSKLPKNLTHPSEFRKLRANQNEKGNFTLRATPEKEWLELASKHVGKIKVPYVIGSGISAVKVADDKSDITKKPVIAVPKLFKRKTVE